MAIRIPFAGKYVYFGPETGLHTQGEARAETYDLTGPRYYDGHDLSALTWYVRATHPDYRTIINKQLSVTIASDNEETVVISWPVEADFMACSGELQVQFVAKSAAGTEIIKLQSNGLQISPSVEGTAAPPKNMFENALAQMQDLADAAVNAAAQSKQDAERADEAAVTTAESVAAAEKAVDVAKESVEEAAGLVEQVDKMGVAAADSAKLAESWAAGGTGTREGEETNNAKYYALLAQQVAQGGVGYYETPETLRDAHPTGQAGNWAIIGSTDTIWVWDTNTNNWVDSRGNIDLSNYYPKAEADARFAPISSSVPTVVATKTQNTFNIAIPDSNQFVIIPDADYVAGDTFQVEGNPVTAMLSNGDSLPNAFFTANAKVICLWADTILYFVGGGGGTLPNNVMRYRLDDDTQGQPAEQTIWGQTSGGQDAYVYSSTEAVVDKDTGKTLKQILQEGSAGGGTVNTVDGITAEDGNVLLLLPAETPPSGKVLALDADTLQGHTADDFAKIVHYSTQEQPTGELWIDGKKVYHKVVTGTMPSANTAAYIPIGVSVDTPISAIGFLIDAGGNHVPLTSTNGSVATALHNNIYVINYAAAQNPNTLSLSAGSTSHSQRPFYCVLKYTKPDE